MANFRILANTSAFGFVKTVTAAMISPHPSRAFLLMNMRRSSSAAAASPPSPANSYPSRRQKKRITSPDLAPPPSAEEAVSHILYNSPGDASSNNNHRRKHIFNCLVQNEPGVLSRVSGILAGRGFNIDSLVVAKTDVADLSRMTIVLRGETETVEQARRQLEDLIPVWAVLDYTGFKIIQRELLLVKVSILGPEHVHMQKLSSASSHNYEDDLTLSPSKALLHTQAHLGSLTELSRLFQGRIVDVSTDCAVIELSAKPDRIDAFIKLVNPFGILEAARSGMMAMPRSQIFDVYEGHDQEKVQEEGSGVDASLLPPG
ncbi:hypothetical protein BGZ83_011242 [Gryganskiella cystojenkinii]|nr:hypothetical protein BGZ83_011242 [Gryganskiella cystojenkinii]